jgi:hypothetical protein
MEEQNMVTKVETVEVGVEAKPKEVEFVLPTLIKPSDAMREGAKIADGYSRNSYVYRRGKKLYACDIGRLYLGLGGDPRKMGRKVLGGSITNMITEKTGVNIEHGAREHGLPNSYFGETIHDWIVDRNANGCDPETTIRILEEHGL